MQSLTQTEHANANADPITHAPGSHPIGTGLGGAVGGAIAGAAVGTVLGPVGTAIGAAVGAIAGGLAGKSVAESVNPTSVSEPTLPDSLATVLPHPDHEMIALQAYGIWEQNGRTAGHALDDWLQAETRLKSV